MYRKYIVSLKEYIKSRDDLTIARHVFAFRAKDASLKDIIDHFLFLEESEKKVILSCYDN